MKAIAFSPAAEADIGEIWDYSADRWGADQADSYTDTIRDACDALARGKKQGRPSVLPSSVARIGYSSALSRPASAPPWC